MTEGKYIFVGEMKKGGNHVSQKDIAEKILESYNDVFSDIVNVLLFDGREVVPADELEDQAPRAYYKTDGKIREIERDVAKRWKQGGIRIACVGLENQTRADPDMPLRIIGYDGAEYRAQLLADRMAGSRYPVVTLVLYFGCEKHWDQPLSLKERLEIPPEWDRFVNDYRINLFEIAYLDANQVELFQSDFRIVADYFVQKREKGDYIPSEREIRHVQETLQLLSVMSGDYRFEEAYYSSEAEGGLRNMCDVLDRVESKGIEKGIAKGIEKGLREGRMEAKREMAVSLAEMGLSVEKIAEAARVSTEVVRQWIACGGHPAG